MSKTTQDIIQPNLDKVIEFGMQLEKDGTSREVVMKLVNAYRTKKLSEFYQQKDDEKLMLSNILGEVEKRYSSEIKAERILFHLLKEHEIKFDFQVKIGPYIVDYLIANSIVIEGDGPWHSRNVLYDKRRDNYLEKMGYEVWRFSWDEIALCQKNLIAALKERTSE